MKSPKIKALKVISPKIGALEFKPHFENKDLDFVSSMWCFVGNNWELLGDFNFSIVLSWDDGTESEETFSGINASANLAGFIEDL